MNLRTSSALASPTATAYGHPEGCSAPVKRDIFPEEVYLNEMAKSSEKISRRSETGKLRAVLYFWIAVNF